MKKKLIIGLIFVLCVGIISIFIINNNQNNARQFDTHDDLTSLKIDSSRYIILYDTQDRNYIITTVDKYGLGTDLYNLGKEAYNFNINNKKLELCAADHKLTYDNNKWIETKEINNSLINKK